MSQPFLGGSDEQHQKGPGVLHTHLDSPCLLTHQDSMVAFARACFLNRLVARSNTSAEIMPSTEAWLDFGTGHVPYYTGVSEKFMGITLLRIGISFSPCLLGN